MHSVVTPRPVRSGFAIWALPALLMLIVQFGLYMWMAPRGFDFTDESYYFLNYLHWREFTGTVTFFGAFFELPFRAMGQSIAGMRLLTLALVAGSAAVLMREMLRFTATFTAARSGAPDGSQGMRLRHTWYYLAAPMASAMLYFGYLSTLRAPSYNVLSLCSMALATACLLRTLAQQRIGASAASSTIPRAAPLLYGVALGACFLSKATTSVVLVLVHLAFFGAVNHLWAWKRLALLVLLITLGFALPFILLTVAFPGWLDSLREGIVLMGIRGGYSRSQMLGMVGWELRQAVRVTGPWLFAAGLLLFVIRRRIDAGARTLIALLALVLVAASVITTTVNHQNVVWLPVLAGVALALWGLEWLARRTRDPIPLAEVRSELALMALLFTLPLAFSFGTNMPVMGHSAIAGLFPFCAVYLRLYRLFHAGLLTPAALAACTFLLCIPGLATQYRALTDAHFTYRQHSALGAQDSALALGQHGAVLRLDLRTAQSIRTIADTMREAGFMPGQDILDMSGDSPGVIYAVGGRPLGTPWMIGRYPGSEPAAERIMQQVGVQAVRGAWLLSSTNNPRRLKDWQAMLERQAGAGSHRLAASIVIPATYPWTGEASDRVNLQIWKPADPAVAGR